MKDRGHSLTESPKVVKVVRKGDIDGKQRAALELN
jgi:hypothetical protein